MLAIVDYGVGNLFSLARSFEAAGERPDVVSDPDALSRYDRIVLPGVGAFGDAAKKLRESGMAEALTREAKRGKPLLGICLGMQLLLERSYEYGEHAGLGLIPGDVQSIAPIIAPGLKVPHIGWNALSFPDRKCPLFAKAPDGAFVYFVHSYSAQNCAPHIAATTEYGGEIVAAVARPPVYGVQFHPEKSGKTGLSILAAFLDMEGTR